MYLMGFGTYTLFDVPAETPITLLGEHQEYITVTGDTATAIHTVVPNDGTSNAAGDNILLFSGDVEITISGEFGSASIYSTEGYLKTERKAQSHRPSSEYTCAGICLSDDNFNDICDEYEGCMDETACNYNPTATYDDGSCVDAWRCTGCMDITACNYNINATKPGVDSVVYISSTYEFFPQGATETPGTIVYTPPGLGSEGYLIPAYCIYTEDDCQECSGDVDGSGIVMFGDTLIGGQTWCEQEVGCGDPLACDFNQDVHPVSPRNTGIASSIRNPEHVNIAVVPSMAQGSSSPVTRTKTAFVTWSTPTVASP